MKWTDALDFNTNWRFAITAAAEAVLPDFDDTDFASVTLPHDWQIVQPRDAEMERGTTQGFYPRYAVGVYRCTFAACDAWKGKRVQLLFDGVQRFSEVYLNGELVGGHRFGYLPFFVDLTGKLKAKNVLAVRVNNSDTFGDRWYSGAGITRGVRLLIDAPVHVAPWSIFTTYELDDKRAEVSTKVALANTTDAAENAVLKLTVKGPNGVAVYSSAQSVTAAPGETEYTFTYTLSNALRWDIDTPNLYRVEASVSSACGEDVAQETLGFRTFSFDGENGFTLNGRTRKFYGADLHNDGGIVFGAAVPRAIVRRRLESLRKMGCNAIRCSHNPHDENLYELCDEMGFVMVDELYDKWNGTSLYFEKLYDEDWEKDLTTMVKRDRNHPAVVLWSMGNELEIQYSDFFFSQFPVMRAKTLSLDPTRPVTIALVTFLGDGEYGEHAPIEKRVEALTRYSEMVDVFCVNYMENYYRLMRESGMNKAILGTEVFSYYRFSDLPKQGLDARSPWRDAEELDYVAGGLVWAGVDYLGEAVAGYPSKGWTGCPVDSTGIWKLRAWHLAGQWSKGTPMLRIATFDESVPDDGASHMWGFPKMSGHWNFTAGEELHLGIMSNCEEVRLYLNDEPVRVCSEPAEDLLFHFTLPYQPGTLRAEGIIDGKVAAEQVLRTANGPASVALSIFASKPDEDGITTVEAWLLDEYGQPWTLGEHEVQFTVSGDAALIGVDCGDFMAVPDPDPYTDRCLFYNGHAVAYLRVTDEAQIAAVCEGMAAMASL